MIPVDSFDIISSVIHSFDSKKAEPSLPPVRKYCHMLNPLPDAEMLPRKEVRILSFNIFLRPCGLISDIHGDYKDERMVEFLNLLPEYDIIGLEEIFEGSDGRKKQMIKLAKEAGFAHIIQSPAPQDGSLDGGLLLMSRFPMVECEFSVYPTGPLFDAITAKGVLYARIQIKQAFMHLFFSHQFETYVEADYCLQIRMESIKVMRKLINKWMSKAPPGELCMIMGDFNIDPLHPVDVKPNELKNDEGNNEKVTDYQNLINVLSDYGQDDIEDLKLKQYGKFPSTFADIYGKDKGCSLDYIFILKPKGLEYHNGQTVEKPEIKVIKNTFNINPFPVENKPFKQLSDHYGVELSLEYCS
jgi:sphingomyelin phosphodiesterase